MIDWQPIETAPKDGTQVLLWLTPDWGDEPEVGLGQWVGGDLIHDLSFDGEITHWAPINPPEEKA